MQYLNRFHPIRLRTTVRQLEKTLQSNNAIAKQRKEILEFFGKHGLQATKDAFKITKIQTDNGSEFAGYFSNYLKNNEIEHFHNYPGYPRGNAYIERFNRTIRQQYVNANMDWIDDTQEFNKKLMNYLLWYNSKRPHRGIGYMTPLDYVANEMSNDPKKSNMLRDYTVYPNGYKILKMPKIRDFWANLPRIVKMRKIFWKKQNLSKEQFIIHGKTSRNI
jgi:hypothetical protein